MVRALATHLESAINSSLSHQDANSKQVKILEAITTTLCMKAILCEGTTGSETVKGQEPVGPLTS